MNPRRILALALTATAGLAAPRAASAQTVVTNPTNQDVTQAFPTPANAFEFIVAGDQRANFTNINAAGQSVNEIPQPRNAIAVTYDGTNTHINYSGGFQDQQSGIGMDHSHFGFARDSTSLGSPLLSESPNNVDGVWLNGSTVLGHIPTVNAVYTGLNGPGPDHYYVIYVEPKYSGASSGNPYTLSAPEWFEFNGPANLPGSVTFQDLSSDTISLSNARFFTSDTLIPLDQLNMNDLPPTDPRFQPLLGVPDGTQLLPGGETNAQPVPEPGSVMLLGLGVAGLLALARRRARAYARRNPAV